MQRLTGKKDKHVLASSVTFPDYFHNKIHVRAPNCILGGFLLRPSTHLPVWNRQRPLVTTTGTTTHTQFYSMINSPTNNRDCKMRLQLQTKFRESNCVVKMHLLARLIFSDTLKLYYCLSGSLMSLAVQYTIHEKR